MTRAAVAVSSCRRSGLHFRPSGRGCGRRGKKIPPAGEAVGGGFEVLDGSVVGEDGALLAGDASGGLAGGTGGEVGLLVGGGEGIGGASGGDAWADSVGGASERLAVCWRAV